MYLLGRDFSRCRELLDLGMQAVKVDLCDRQPVITACAGMEAVFQGGAISAPCSRRIDFFEINERGRSQARCKLR